MGPVLAMVVPAALFFVLLQSNALDVKLSAPTGHFYIVSIVALLSMMIAMIVGAAGSRLRNIKVSFLSLAFISLAEMFAIHGLSTPHFIIHVTPLPGVAAQLSVLLASFWLWMSSLHTDHPIIERISRWRSFLVPVWTILLGAFGLVGLLFTHIVDLIPLDKNPMNVVVSTIVVLFNLSTAYRYYQSYRYSRFPLQISIVYSCGWLIVSQMIMILGELWMLSWWLYHFLLLASMLVMLYGLYRQYSSDRSLTSALRGLFTTDPLERVTSSLSQSVRALILATENKDVYTAGHNFRVTLYALKLGEELKLDPDSMRALAQGSIVHDVGKINIPDVILNKPGKLSLEERVIIELHPIRGYEMCRSLGFMKEELDIIRSHHEKWDGTGYPDKLAGEQIPHVARVVAVADVYDALTSSRSYRHAWTHEKAMELIRENRGVHFDPRCVDAWIRVCTKDPHVYEYPNKVVSAQQWQNLPAAGASDVNI